MSQLPNELWRTIIMQATHPSTSGVHSLGEDEISIARIFDPDSLGDQKRIPWRQGYKLPIDTVTSLRAKHALAQVSRRLYDLSCEFLYETLYIRRPEGLLNLENTLKRELANDRSKVERWTKYIYVFMEEDMTLSDSWVQAVVFILQHSTALQGFIHYCHLPGWHVPPAHSVSPILRAIPLHIKHFEWINLKNINFERHIPPDCLHDDELLGIPRRINTLTALRLRTGSMFLPADVTLPHLKYLDIDALHRDLWPHLPALTHITSNGHCFWSTSAARPVGEFVLGHGQLPLLSYAFFERIRSPFTLETLRSIINSAPNLTQLHCCYNIRTGIWQFTRSDSIRSLELHITGPPWPDTEYRETNLLGLRGHLLPLTEALRYPALTDFTLSGLSNMITSSDEKKRRLYELARIGLTDLTARGVQVRMVDE